MQTHSSTAQPRIHVEGKPFYAIKVATPLGEMWEVRSLYGHKLGAFNFPGEPGKAAHQALAFALHATLGKPGKL